MSPNPIIREFLAIAALLIATPATADSTAVFCPQGYFAAMVNGTATCVQGSQDQSPTVGT